MIGQKEHEEELQLLIDASVRHAPTDREMGVQQADEIFQNIIGAGAPVVPLASDRDVDSGRDVGRARNVGRRKHVWWVAAACILALLWTGDWLFPRHEKGGMAKATSSIERTGLIPAGNKATLTLGDGSTILLDSSANGMVASEGSTRVIKLDSGRIAYQADGSHEGSLSYNVIHTPRGGKYEVTLPDGTKVWMNAASSLRFPTVFNGLQREVALTGEAYFEVAENRQMPFNVSIGEATVKVLGTHFNINAYSDERSIHTTLLEGAVQFSSGGAGKLLHPGEQAVFDDSTSALSVHEADINQVMAWKNGRFEFDNIDLPAVMRQISRWYDVDVEYRVANRNVKLGGGISRTSNLQDLLPLLEASGVHCKLEGRKIVIY
jgi:ferric-dicitrate binding protein FerR (iron transport regulator)